MNGKMSHHRVGPQTIHQQLPMYGRGSISVDRVPQDARARANLIRTPQQEFGDEAACGLRPGSVESAWVHWWSPRASALATERMPIRRGAAARCLHATLTPPVETADAWSWS